MRTSLQQLEGNPQSQWTIAHLNFSEGIKLNSQGPAKETKNGGGGILNLKFWFKSFKVKGHDLIGFCLLFNFLLLVC